AGLVDHGAGDLQLRIDAETGDELFADRDQREGHAPDEIFADVHRGFAWQQDVLALVGDVGQAVDVRRENGDGLVKVIRRQLDARDLDQLFIVARGDGE